MKIPLPKYLLNNISKLHVVFIMGSSFADHFGKKQSKTIRIRIFSCNKQCRCIIIYREHKGAELHVV